MDEQILKDELPATCTAVKLVPRRGAGACQLRFRGRGARGRRRGRVGLLVRLGVHLGVRELHLPGQSKAYYTAQGRGNRAQEHTSAERFRLLLASQTAAWHVRRHRLAQQLAREQLELLEQQLPGAS